MKLTHPRYAFIGNRHQLRRVLSAIALTDAHLGFDKDGGWWDTHLDHMWFIAIVFLVPFFGNGDGSLLWVKMGKAEEFSIVAGSHYLGFYNPCNNQLRGRWCFDG